MIKDINEALEIYQIFKKKYASDYAWMALYLRIMSDRFIESDMIRLLNLSEGRYKHGNIKK